MAWIALTMSSTTGVYTVVPERIFSTARLILILLNSLPLCRLFAQHFQHGYVPPSDSITAMP